MSPVYPLAPCDEHAALAAKKRAVEILIERRGDKALQGLSRDDALAFADWWEDRVVNEGISRWHREQKHHPYRRYVPSDLRAAAGMRH